MRVSQACDLLQQCAHAERFCEIDVCLKAALLCMWFIFLLVHFLSLQFFFLLPGLSVFCLVWVLWSPHFQELQF